MKSENNIFSILYLLFFITLPIVYSSSIVDPVLSPRLIYLSMFCGLLMIVIGMKRNELKKGISFSFSQSLLPLALIAFVMATIFSVFQAKVSSESYFTIARIISSSTFFFVTTFLILKGFLSVERLSKSVLWFALMSSLIAIYQIMSLDEVNPSSVTGTMANKNLLSSALFICLPFLLLNKFENINFRFFNYVTVGLVILIIVYLRTRAVLIPLIGSFAIFGIYFAFTKFKKQSKKLTVAVLIAIPIIIISGSILFQKSQYYTTISNSNTLETRTKLWVKTGTMISDNVIFGVGAGNWKIEFPKYGIGDLPPNAAEGRMIYQRPHNDFLWAFAETGIVGFMAFCLLFLFALFYSIKQFINSTNDEEKKNFLIIALATFGFAFVSFFDYPFERIEHQILFLAFVSIIVTKTTNANSTQVQNFKIELKATKPIYFSLSGLIIFSLFIGFKRFEGEKNMRKIYEAHQEHEWSEMETLVDQSKNKYYLIDPMSVPLDWYKGVALFTMDDVEMANKTFREAYNLAPYNIYVLNNLASSYEKVGQRDLAIKYYKEALRISPKFEEALLNLSAVYFNKQEYDKAYNLINTCSINSKDPKYKTFLPAILRKKIINELSKKGSDIEPFSALSNEDLMSKYFESKRLNINFVDLILNH